MKIKVSKHKLNIHYQGSPWGSRTQEHAYCLHYAHSQHIESHLCKKQPQAKIPIAFLFSQRHFNNVTLNAPFYGGHLVMRSAKPGNHLNKLFVFRAFQDKVFFFVGGGGGGKESVFNILSLHSFFPFVLLFFFTARFVALFIVFPLCGVLAGYLFSGKGQRVAGK